MKITKATVKRINGSCMAGKPGYIHEISTLGDILSQSAVILGFPGQYTINDGDEYVTPMILSDGERGFIPGETEGYGTNCVMGLASRYPDLISASDIIGIGSVRIYDANKLIRLILSDPIYRRY